MGPATDTKDDVMNDMNDAGFSVGTKAEEIDRRKKRLELNRKAAQESRKRRKVRIEELQRTVVYLTRENGDLRDQNEVLRQMLSSDAPVENTALMDRYQAENASLKLALYESVQNLSSKVAEAQRQINGGSGNQQSSSHTGPAVTVGGAPLISSDPSQQQISGVSGSGGSSTMGYSSSGGVYPGGDTSESHTGSVSASSSSSSGVAAAMTTSAAGDEVGVGHQHQQQQQQLADMMRRQQQQQHQQQQQSFS